VGKGFGHGAVDAAQLPALLPGVPPHLLPQALGQGQGISGGRQVLAVGVQPAYNGEFSTPETL